MNEYEIAYLADPKLSEQEKAKLDEAVDKLIADKKGEITYSSVIDAPSSRRRLHYPIGEQRVAWVRVMQTNIEPNKIEDVRELIRKQDNVLRASIIKSSRREEVPPELLATLTEKRDEKKPVEAIEEKPKKKVSAEEIDEGIEKALDEEVK